MADTKDTDSKGRPPTSKSLMRDRYKRVRIAHLDWSLKACAIEAGMPAKYAAQQAQRWERHADLIGLKLLAERELEDAGASLQRTIKELTSIGYSDLRKVVTWDADGVTPRPSSELTDEEAAGVAEVSEVLGKDGVRGVRVKMHSKPEALAALLRFYAPEKAVALTQNNLNIRILVVDADGNALKGG